MKGRGDVGPARNTAVRGLAMLASLGLVTCAPAGAGRLWPALYPIVPERFCRPGFGHDAPKSIARRDPRRIQHAVRGRYPQLQQCYEQALARNPDAAGRVAVRFTIPSDGRVRYACLTGSGIDDDRLADCVIYEFEKLEFWPVISGETRVFYPIMFSPTLTR